MIVWLAFIIGEVAAFWNWRVYRQRPEAIIFGLIAGMFYFVIALGIRGLCRVTPIEPKKEP